MDERDLLASQLLDQAGEQRHLYDAGHEIDLLQAILYILAVETLDWKSAEWQTEWLFKKSITGNADQHEDRITLLMDNCGAEKHRPWLNSPALNTLTAIVRQALTSQDYDDRLYLFDALFYHLITVALDIDRRHAEIVAALANGLARHNALFDLNAYSGEPQILHHRIDKGPNTYHVGPFITPHQDLVKLRMVVRQIQMHSSSVEPVDRSSLTLLDFPTPQSSSPLSVLLERFSELRPIRRKLVIFNPSKRGLDGEQWRRLHDQLDYDDLLEAVIDFTSYSPKGRPIKLCAFLLNSEKFSGGQTLCIDARWLADDKQGVTTEQTVWFAAAVCELWASPTKFRINQFPLTRLGKLKGLYNQLFEDGYQDIEGLCKVLPSQQVLRKPIASRHLPKRENLYRPSLLDSRPLTDLLLEEKEIPLCAYVIGNNGAGKSLLLNSLIDQFDMQGRVSIGIAFGPTDRFPLPEQEKHSSFRYLGGRTAQGFSSRHVEGELIALLAYTFACPERFAVLEEVLARVDFGDALCLVPRGVADAVLRTYEHARRIVPLPHAADLTGKRRKSMDLALQRQGDSQFIRFTQLSSGEQQILLLLGKIVAAAEPGSVLLVDEPEISLHVQWQQRLPGLFSLMADRLKCSFVIATHSPTLIANSRDSLSHCFLARDQTLTPIRPEQRHSVETILLDGFETYTPHNREIAERCAALVAEAIRATNRHHRPSPLQHEALLKELGLMSQIMASSGNHEDQRYKQDEHLITQARAAIEEAYKLAEQEVVA